MERLDQIEKIKISLSGTQKYPEWRIKQALMEVLTGMYSWDPADAEGIISLVIGRLRSGLK